MFALKGNDVLQAFERTVRFVRGLIIGSVDDGFQIWWRNPGDCGVLLMASVRPAGTTAARRWGSFHSLRDDECVMNEEQQPNLDYATPGLRSRADIMTNAISLIFYGGTALAMAVWLVWIEEWQVRGRYSVLAVSFMAFALWQACRSLRKLLRS
jgi:hypothetical protein